MSEVLQINLGAMFTQFSERIDNSSQRTIDFYELYLEEKLKLAENHINQVSQFKFFPKQIKNIYHQQQQQKQLPQQQEKLINPETLPEKKTKRLSCKKNLECINNRNQNQDDEIVMSLQQDLQQLDLDFIETNNSSKSHQRILEDQDEYYENRRTIRDYIEDNQQEKKNDTNNSYNNNFDIIIHHTDNEEEQQRAQDLRQQPQGKRKTASNSLQKSNDKNIFKSKVRKSLIEQFSEIKVQNKTELQTEKAQIQQQIDSIDLDILFDKLPIKQIEQSNQKSSSGMKKIDEKFIENGENHQKNHEKKGSCFQEESEEQEQSSLLEDYDNNTNGENNTNTNYNDIAIIEASSDEDINFQCQEIKSDPHSSVQLFDFKELSVIDSIAEGRELTNKNSIQNQKQISNQSSQQTQLSQQLQQQQQASKHSQSSQQSSSQFQSDSSQSMQRDDEFSLQIDHLQPEITRNAFQQYKQQYELEEEEEDQEENNEYEMTDYSSNESSNAGSPIFAWVDKIPPQLSAPQLARPYHNIFDGQVLASQNQNYQYSQKQQQLPSQMKGNMNSQQTVINNGVMSQPVSSYQQFYNSQKQQGTGWQSQKQNQITALNTSNSKTINNLTHCSSEMFSQNGFGIGGEQDDGLNFGNYSQYYCNTDSQQSQFQPHQKLLLLQSPQKIKTEKQRRQLYCNNKAVPTWAEDLKKVTEEVRVQNKSKIDPISIFGHFAVENLNLKAVFKNTGKRYDEGRGSSANWRQDYTPEQIENLINATSQTPLKKKQSKFTSFLQNQLNSIKKKLLRTPDRQDQQ